MRISGTTSVETSAGHQASFREHLTLTRLAGMLPLLFVFALFIGYLVVLLLYGRAVIRFPFDYDQGEGFELYDAVRLAHGQNIYLNNAAFPFYSSNYPPVYRLMLVPLVWLFGSHLWVGRALTLACTLLIGGLVALAALRQMQAVPRAKANETSFLVRLVVAMVAGLAFLAANYVYQIAPLARAHLPMVMFAFAGILCLERAFEPAEPDQSRPMTTRSAP